MQNICPQCKNTLKQPSCRLIQDTCGHQKCRLCLLNDEEKCEQCIIAKEKDNSICSSVIKYENNHTAVISFNGIDDNGNKKKQKNVKLDDQKPRETTESNKRFYQTLPVPNHILVSNEIPTKYTCKVCGRQFKTRSHIKYHQYCASGKKPLQCAFCSKDFISKAHLEFHILSHTGRKPHSCDSCGKSFSQKAKLNRHMLLHSNLKPFVCPKCGKSFRTNDKLKVHTLIHTKEKPFACKQCKAKFNNSSNLKKHLAVHIKEGIHMCDQCGKRFKLRSTLMAHRKIHSNNKSYSCTICTKAFHNLKDLQRHMLIHTDEKAYNCDICNTSFRRKDNLNRHLRNTHPGKKASYTQKTVKIPISKPAIVESPNAINVITPSPACSVFKKPESIEKDERDKRTVPVINGPIKMASKTSAFKDCYNIHRNSVDVPDNVSVYEKILLPNNIPKVASSDVQSVRKPAEILKNDFSPLHYGTSFEHKTHAIIKNIKFKLPKEYLNLSNKDKADFVHSAQNITDQMNGEQATTDATSADTHGEVTSVIVNTANCHMSDTHWRKRTTQNFNTSHLESQF